MISYQAGSCASNYGRVNILVTRCLLVQTPVTRHKKHGKQNLPGFQVKAGPISTVNVLSNQIMQSQIISLHHY